ncbi:MAG: hypothetical protein AUH82_00695 [Chloroflexi bacterium 13_1_40CM_4_65_13]|nr:MAG: hypothetical protein AUH82_00695 [Chloroflexi bacterium 13_1_40CM_4_65_13]
MSQGVAPNGAEIHAVLRLKARRGSLLAAATSSAGGEDAFRRRSESHRNRRGRMHEQALQALALHICIRARLCPSAVAAS